MGWRSRLLGVNGGQQETGSARVQGGRLPRALRSVVWNLPLILMAWEVVGECWEESAMTEVLR